ncbi:MAG: DegV family protein [Tepidibacter sp.]|jgi:DegV family protein with EDD domain|uniref:DegV family protein n=1 Tax=Tepidibacter sp. TaxID=2529387 RepID=UPI0025D8A65B|nr:DegV family protein [Tepidibacter sp.]MCT4509366.1 DegV family protein [Tepidibacter sp.]
MIKIIADSTCDLSQDLIDKYDIGIAPLTINIDGKLCRDRIDIKPDEFYSIIENLNEEPTTAMPSPLEFLNIMNEAVSNGHTHIICICMSSGTSGSYQSAVIAKDYFYDENKDSNVKIHIVDSRSMSHGSGWLILKSAMLREKGMNFEEIVKFNETYKTNVKHFLSVDDLDHLIRGGRISRSSAFIGKMLKIKPIMSMKKGKGAIVAKERGRKRVLKHYVDEFISRNDEEITDFIIIGYTSDISVAENLKNKINKETDFKGDIYIMQIGVAVGAHVGPGGISMFYVEKGNKKDNLLINEMQGLMEKKAEIMEKIKNAKLNS